MPRKPTRCEVTQQLRDKIFEHEAADWRNWRAAQTRYRSLLPKAFDCLAEALDAGGPDAAKVALMLIRMADITAAPPKPNRLLLALEDPDELAALSPAETTPPAPIGE